MDSADGSRGNETEGKSTSGAGGDYGTDPNSPGNDIEVSPNSGMTSSGSSGGGIGGGTTPSGKDRNTSLDQPPDGHSGK